MDWLGSDLDWLRNRVGGYIGEDVGQVYLECVGGSE